MPVLEERSLRETEQAARSRGPTLQIGGKHQRQDIAADEEKTSKNRLLPPIFFLIQSTAVSQGWETLMYVMYFEATLIESVTSVTKVMARSQPLPWIQYSSSHHHHLPTSFPFFSSFPELLRHWSECTSTLNCDRAHDLWVAMHAMPPRLAQLSLDPAHSSHPPSTPSQGSPYRSCAASANLSSTSMHPSPIHFPHSYRVAHHGGSMHVQCADLPPSLSPAIASPVPSSAGAGPSSLVRQHSSHGQADRTGSPPPPTPRPLEPVVTTSTLESAHDDNGRPMVNQYVIYQRIGKGQHGSVYKAFDRDMPVVSLLPSL